ncbi:hypothetical protein [Tomelloso virus]|uniref:Uncharacterized protein n=1 Tax=Tomelloso virus TaxID=2053981 RepID=A0A2H4T2S6_9VIRU|nr:hypothetical protein [Tomelloso virus]ATY70233.1 hypothetical protein [Tomelloso virus]
MMDIGDPLWFLRSKTKLRPKATSSRRINRKLSRHRSNSKNNTYRDLELVISNILKDHAKGKNSEEMLRLKRRPINDGIIEEPEEKPAQIIETPVAEATNVDQQTESPEESDDTENDSEESEESCAVEDILNRPSHRRTKTPTAFSDINKVKNVISKLEHQLDHSIRTEHNHSSRKYKILIASRRIVRIIKYPIIGLCAAVGFYYMTQPYSNIVTSIVTNSSSNLFTMLLSVVSAFAGK